MIFLVIVIIPVVLNNKFSFFQSRLPHFLHEKESPERFRRSGETRFPFWLVMDRNFFFLSSAFSTFIHPLTSVKESVTPDCKESNFFSG